MQTVLTCIIGGAGIILIVASVVTGSVDNLQGQMFVGNGTGEAMKSIIKVAVITPFFFIGFDVIPQAAEEINVPLKKSVNDDPLCCAGCCILLTGDSCSRLYPESGRDY